LVNPNLKDLLFWTFRRNETDVINLYDYLSSIMQVATSGNMLNFGYWKQDTRDPVAAQTNLCDIIGDISDLKNAKNLLDVGSGFSEPAIIWKKKYPVLDISSLNINQNQLRFAKQLLGNNKNLELVNSTATTIPFRESAFDRVIALESAQHFKPLDKFVQESSRVLDKDGILCIAIPILADSKGPEILKIGILKFTWSSEHYDFKTVERALVSNGFKITRKEIIGDMVYPPLADYYIKNRESIKSRIIQKYPAYVEKILYRSIQKMKEVSEKGIIQYVLIKSIKSH
jgi:ubiquinone/menaquinone biosynthesis C-methylase UbiE